ncbi:protein MARD1-like [Quillaja saponaria]|uniref:Protein MARD1-like n=1 Tax=Quillaja saponaria TaxID=32244 RepID=A0AAD7QAI0_QUISA|nr:protein MARD1-like [Quillaja saponaria]
MLRNRSRAVTSKQALMADHGSQPSASQNYTRALPYLFGYPKFGAFTTKCLSGSEALRSPTSILDSSRPFSPSGHPFSYDRRQPLSPKISSEQKHSWDKLDSEGIGLALVDALKDELCEGGCSKPSNGKIFFATNLRVQIPPLPPTAFSPTKASKIPADLGTKIQNSYRSPFECVKDSPGIDSASENFLSFCYTCKKNLEQTKDIFIYRGEKAFCSRQCRYQEMLLDDVENSEFDNGAYIDIA